MKVDWVDETLEQSSRMFPQHPHWKLCHVPLEPVEVQRGWNSVDSKWNITCSRWFVSGKNDPLQLTNDEVLECFIQLAVNRCHWGGLYIFVEDKANNCVFFAAFCCILVLDLQREVTIKFTWKVSIHPAIAVSMSKKTNWINVWKWICLRLRWQPKQMFSQRRHKIIIRSLSVQRGPTHHC